MAEVEHRFVEANGVRLHTAELGDGPLVLLLHGFPECWYSWRRQFQPLADAGFRVVAPDQRGYCRSDQPQDVTAYTLLHLVGDVVGLIHALGENSAVVVGHDWGAPVAWTTAVMRPDLVRGVVGLSVPPTPRGPVPPLAAMRAVLGDGYYMNYFQTPGVADAELARDPRTTFRRMLGGSSGDSPNAASPWLVPPGGGFLDVPGEPQELPAWLTEEDIEVYAAEYADSGFTGALNWYRNIDRDWELLGPWDGARVEVPALYMAGERDLVTALPGVPELIADLPRLAPRLRRTVILPGCGHWTQQERPEEVNAGLLDFLEHL